MAETKTTGRESLVICGTDSVRIQGAGCVRVGRKRCK